MKLNLTEVQDYINRGLITSRPNSDGDLFVLNYTPKVQIERVWDTMTKMCRGIVIDREGNVIGRPFEKFFNYEEVSDKLPNEPFEVFSKLDGSLGIAFKYNNKIQICTRGSFESDQAKHAVEIWNAKYAVHNDLIQPGFTWLFEIIYPENMIVVNYEGLDDLVLLTIIDNETGQDVQIPNNTVFNVVQRWDGYSDIKVLKNLNIPNNEGFVLKYASGFRVKVKFEEYVRLHRIMTGISNKTVWEWLMNNDDFNAVLQNVPDEFYTWIKETEKDFKTRYFEIESIAKSLYKELPTRKETAIYFTSCSPYTGILFQMYDGMDYSGSIWKMLRPKYEKAVFKVPDEEC